MSDLTVALVVALKDQLTGAPAAKLKQTLEGISASGKKMGKDFSQAIKSGFSVDNIDEAIARNQQKFQQARGRLQGALAMAASVAIPIKLEADFEEAFIDFANVAEIPLDQRRRIEDLLIEASRETGKSKGELLAALSAYIGKGLDVQSGLDALIATGMTASATKSEIDDMANSGYAVMDNLNVAARDLSTAFDVMALSGKEGSFELKAMARKFPEITAGARSLKMQGIPAVAALSSALQLAMKAAGSEDQAATNLSNFLGKITAPDTVKKFAKFGVNVEKEMKLAQKKGVDVLDHMLTIIADKTGGDAFKMGELFADKQVLDFLRAIIPNLEEYRRQRDKVVKADGSTIAEDYGKVASGLNFHGRQLRNALGELVGSAGPLLPMMKSLTFEATQLVYALSNWTAANPELAATIVKVAAGLLMFGVASRVAAFALAAVRGPLIMLVSQFLKFDEAGKNVSNLARVFGAFRVAGVGASAGVVAAFKGLAAVLAGAAGAISLPVVAIAAAFVAAGVLIYRYWEPISNFFSGFASVVGQELNAATAAVSKFVADAASWAGDKLVDAAAWFGVDEATVRTSLATLSAWGESVVSFFTALPGRIGNWLSNLFTMQDYSSEAEAGFRSAGESAGHMFVEAIKLSFNGLFLWFGGLPARIVSAIGNIDLSGLITWPSLPKWLGGGDGRGGTGAVRGDVTGTSPSIGDRAGANNPRVSLDGLLGKPAPLPTNAPAPTVNQVTKNEPKISVVNHVKVDKGANASQIAAALGKQTAQKTRLALTDAGVN